MEQNKKLIVIGGGAAGFFCAVNAAINNPSLRITILEKTTKLLSKVKVSGGGRCNVTHDCFAVPELVGNYPRGSHFLKKAFYLFNAKSTVEWFEARGVKTHTEEDGRMFPVTNSSQTIIDCLMAEANARGIEIIMNADFNQLEKTSSGFKLQTSKGDQFTADFVCIACGGFPKPEQFGWLSFSGHSFQPPVPSLFTFNIPKHPITQLMGVSVSDALIKITGSKLTQRGPVLITHWGLSGPATIKLSAWAARELADKEYQFSILVNWIPAYTEQSLRDEWPVLQQKLSTQLLNQKNPFQLPARLWQFLLDTAQIKADVKWLNVSSKDRNKLIQLLTAQPFTVQGKTTFKEEFVTCGGINLSEIEPTTMQSRKVPNLFFAGEIMDVDGITGGFNFQHAWTSGWLAAKAISELSKQ